MRSMSYNNFIDDSKRGSPISLEFEDDDKTAPLPSGIPLLRMEDNFEGGPSLVTSGSSKWQTVFNCGGDGFQSTKSANCCFCKRLQTSKLLQFPGNISFFSANVQGVAISMSTRKEYLFPRSCRDCNHINIWRYKIKICRKFAAALTFVVLYQNHINTIIMLTAWNLSNILFHPDTLTGPQKWYGPHQFAVACQKAPNFGTFEARDIWFINYLESFRKSWKIVKFCESYHRKFPDWKKERGTGSHILNLIMLRYLHRQGCRQGAANPGEFEIFKRANTTNKHLVDANFPPLAGSPRLLRWQSCKAPTRESTRVSKSLLRRGGIVVNFPWVAPLHGA